MGSRLGVRAKIGMVERASSLKVLITGASGFVGHHFVRVFRKRYARRSCFLCGVGRSPLQSEMMGLFDSYHQIDIMTQPLLLRELIASVKPDFLLHLAAFSAPQNAEKFSAEVWDVNFNATLHIARFLHESAPHGWFFYIGSGLSYGESFNNHSMLPLDESAALKPIGSYAASKAAADHALAQMAVQEGLKLLRLRPFNHSGAGQGARFALASFARQIVSLERSGGKGTIQVGNLQASRDFLDVRDVARAYLMAMENPKENGEVYNICSGISYTMKELLERMLELSSADIAVSLKQEMFRLDDIPLIRACSDKFRQSFGWSPQFQISDMLDEILNFFRSRPV